MPTNARWVSRSVNLMQVLVCDFVDDAGSNSMTCCLQRQGVWDTSSGALPPCT